jgi:hypothetical protein
LGDTIKFVAEDDNDEPEKIKTIDILIVQEEIEEKQVGEPAFEKVQHAFAVANKEALTGLKFCPFC